MRRPVFERYPKLRERVRFEPLAELPTPVVDHQGVWVKRDDAIGGGKIRKLEFYHPDGPVLAVGAEGSNWLRALAAHRKVRILTWPQHHNEHSLQNVPHIPGAHARTGLGFAFRMIGELPGLFRSTTLAPVGGSDPVTTLGFVNAAFELAEQVEKGECPKPDAVFVPLGTCGTAAGLALGFGLLGWEVPLHVVRITVASSARLGRVRALALQASNLLDEPARLCPLRLEKGFYGGYGRPIAGGEAAREFFRPLELDSSYTAKAAACLLARRSLYRHPFLWLTYGIRQNQPRCF